MEVSISISLSVLCVEAEGWREGRGERGRGGEAPATQLETPIVQLRTEHETIRRAKTLAEMSLSFTHEQIENPSFKMNSRCVGSQDNPKTRFLFVHCDALPVSVDNETLPPCFTHEQMEKKPFLNNSAGEKWWWCVRENGETTKWRRRQAATLQKCTSAQAPECHSAEWQSFTVPKDVMGVEGERAKG